MRPSLSARLLSTQSDARLVELARHGHERAFEALVLRYRRPLLRYCRRLLGSDDRAEDALQQGLLRAWLALRNGSDVRDPRAWLYRVVHNTALNVIRDDGRPHAQLTDADELRGGEAPEDAVDRGIAVRETLAGLVALPDLQREALLRTAIEGRSHEDAAAAMGVSEGALRGLVYRARTTLRGAMTALTPPPLVLWLAGADPGQQVVEATAAGGSAAGIAGLMVKAGTVAVTAGAVATGVGVVHRHHHDHPRAAMERPVRAGGAVPAVARLGGAAAPPTTTHPAFAPAAASPRRSARPPAAGDDGDGRGPAHGRGERGGEHGHGGASHGSSHPTPTQRRQPLRHQPAAADERGAGRNGAGRGGADRGGRERHGGGDGPTAGDQRDAAGRGGHGGHGGHGGRSQTAGERAAGTALHKAAAHVRARSRTHARTRLRASANQG